MLTEAVNLNARFNQSYMLLLPEYLFLSVQSLMMKICAVVTCLCISQRNFCSLLLKVLSLLASPIMTIPSF